MIKNAQIEKTSMARMKRAIDEYEAKMPNGGQFTTREFNELKQLVEAKGGRPDFYSMVYALQAGYMIGYRKGKAERLKKV